MKKLSAVLGVALALGVSAQALAVDEPENVIKYRQAVMKSIGGHMGAIAGVVKGQVSYVDDVALHAQGMNSLSKIITGAFVKGTDNGSQKKTAALPKIWDDWAGFEKAAQALDTASANLVKVAASGDRQQIAAAFGEVGKACGGCHKPYRAEK